MKYDMDLKDRKHFKDQCATNGYAKEEIKINQVDLQAYIEFLYSKN